MQSLTSIPKQPTTYFTSDFLFTSQQRPQNSQLSLSSPISSTTFMTSTSPSVDNGDSYTFGCHCDDGRRGRYEWQQLHQELCEVSPLVSVTVQTSSSRSDAQLLRNINGSILHAVYNLMYGESRTSVSNHIGPHLATWPTLYAARCAVIHNVLSSQTERRISPRQALHPMVILVSERPVDPISFQTEVDPDGDIPHEHDTDHSNADLSSTHGTSPDDVCHDNPFFRSWSFACHGLADVIPVLADSADKLRSTVDAILEGASQDRAGSPALIVVHASLDSFITSEIPSLRRVADSHSAYLCVDGPGLSLLAQSNRPSDPEDCLALPDVLILDPAGWFALPPSAVSTLQPVSRPHTLISAPNRLPPFAESYVDDRDAGHLVPFLRLWTLISRLGEERIRTRIDAVTTLGETFVHLLQNAVNLETLYDGIACAVRISYFLSRDERVMAAEKARKHISSVNRAIFASIREQAEGLLVHLIDDGEFAILQFSPARVLSARSLWIPSSTAVELFAKEICAAADKYEACRAGRVAFATKAVKCAQLELLNENEQTDELVISYGCFRVVPSEMKSTWRVSSKEISLVARLNAMLAAELATSEEFAVQKQGLQGHLGYTGWLPTEWMGRMRTHRGESENHKGPSDKDIRTNETTEEECALPFSFYLHSNLPNDVPDFLSVEPKHACSAMQSVRQANLAAEIVSRAVVAVIRESGGIDIPKHSTPMVFPMHDPSITEEPMAPVFKSDGEQSPASITEARHFEHRQSGHLMRAKGMDGRTSTPRKFESSEASEEDAFYSASSGDAVIANDCSTTTPIPKIMSPKVGDQRESYRWINSLYRFSGLQSGKSNSATKDNEDIQSIQPSQGNHRSLKRLQKVSMPSTEEQPRNQELYNSSDKSSSTSYDNVAPASSLIAVQNDEDTGIQRSRMPWRFWNRAAVSTRPPYEIREEVIKAENYRSTVATRETSKPNEHNPEESEHNTNVSPNPTIMVQMSNLTDENNDNSRMDRPVTQEQSSSFSESSVERDEDLRQKANQNVDSIMNDTVDPSGPTSANYLSSRSEQNVLSDGASVGASGFDSSSVAFKDGTYESSPRNSWFGFWRENDMDMESSTSRGNDDAEEQRSTIRLEESWHGSGLENPQETSESEATEGVQTEQTEVATQSPLRTDDDIYVSNRDLDFIESEMGAESSIAPLSAFNEHSKRADAQPPIANIDRSADIDALMEDIDRAKQYQDVETSEDELPEIVSSSSSNGYVSESVEEETDTQIGDKAGTSALFWLPWSRREKASDIEKEAQTDLEPERVPESGVNAESSSSGSDSERSTQHVSSSDKSTTTQESLHEAPIRDEPAHVDLNPDISRNSTTESLVSTPPRGRRALERLQVAELQQEIQSQTQSEMQSEVQSTDVVTSENSVTNRSLSSRSSSTDEDEDDEPEVHGEDSHVSEFRSGSESTSTGAESASHSRPSNRIYAVLESNSESSRHTRSNTQQSFPSNSVGSFSSSTSSSQNLSLSLSPSPSPPPRNTATARATEAARRATAFASMARGAKDCEPVEPKSERASRGARMLRWLSGGKSHGDVVTSSTFPTLKKEINSRKWTPSVTTKNTSRGTGAKTRGWGMWNRKDDNQDSGVEESGGEGGNESDSESDSEDESMHDNEDDRSAEMSDTLQSGSGSQDEGSQDEGSQDEGSDEDEEGESNGSDSSGSSRSRAGSQSESEPSTGSSSGSASGLVSGESRKSQESMASSAAPMPAAGGGGHFGIGWLRRQVGLGGGVSGEHRDGGPITGTAESDSSMSNRHVSSVAGGSGSESGSESESDSSSESESGSDQTDARDTKSRGGGWWR